MQLLSAILPTRHPRGQKALKTVTKSIHDWIAQLKILYVLILNFYQAQFV